MSTPYPHVASRIGRSHPAVLSGRARERLLVLMSGLVPLVLALAISVSMPTPSAANVAVVVGGIVGLGAVVALMLSGRYTITLTLLALYLGLLDGPIKLLSTSRVTSGVRDVLIIAIGLGMLMRLSLKKERITLPPLSGWVLGFIAVAVVEGLNPRTNGVLKAIGGYRQELEWVPLFFFGYVIMRSKQRFRQLFLILGVLALANGTVGTIQSRLSPGALAHWGPGYSQRVSGSGGGRTFVSEGVSHPRPPALGSDAGFGGSIGVLALPGLVALLVVGRLRHRWLLVLCCMGALAGIATSASRTSIISLVVALATFTGLSLLVRLRVSRALVGLIVIGVLAAAVVSALIAASGGGIFKRQASIGNVVSSVGSQAVGAEEEGEEGGEGGGDAKTKHLSQIPGDIEHEPFGLGLGSAGSVAGFGGKVQKTIEEEKVSGGSAYNLLAVELGFPGLLLWLGLTVNVLVLVVTRLKYVVDPELRTYLVAVAAGFVAFTFQGFGGPTLAVSPAGAYVWFVPGVIAYWLAGPGRRAMSRYAAAA